MICDVLRLFTTFLIFFFYKIFKPDEHLMISRFISLFRCNRLKKKCFRIILMFIFYAKLNEQNRKRCLLLFWYWQWIHVYRSIVTIFIVDVVIVDDLIQDQLFSVQFIFHTAKDTLLFVIPIEISKKRTI